MGLDIQKIRGEYPRESENPFDSDRKLMSTKHTIDETPIMVVKGAVDVIMGRTASIQCGDEVRAITPEDIEKIEAQNQSFSEKGFVFSDSPTRQYLRKKSCLWKMKQSDIPWSDRYDGSAERGIYGSGCGM